MSNLDWNRREEDSKKDYYKKKGKLKQSKNKQKSGQII